MYNIHYWGVLNGSIYNSTGATGSYENLIMGLYCIYADMYIRLCITLCIHVIMAQLKQFYTL